MFGGNEYKSFGGMYVFGDGGGMYVFVDGDGLKLFGNTGFAKLGGALPSSRSAEAKQINLINLNSIQVFVGCVRDGLHSFLRPGFRFL